MNQDTALNRVKRSLINLESSDPFFSSVALNLKLIEDGSIPTACTDGKELRFNPDYIMSKSRDYIDIVIIHEIIHVILGHPLLLLKLTDKSRALIAMELSDNSLICERKGFPQDGILLPGRGDYINLPLKKNTDWYYNELKKHDDDRSKQHAGATAEDGDENKRVSNNKDTGRETDRTNDGSSNDDSPGSEEPSNASDNDQADGSSAKQDTKNTKQIKDKTGSTAGDTESLRGNTEKGTPGTTPGKSKADGASEGDIRTVKTQTNITSNKDNGSLKDMAGTIPDRGSEVSKELGEVSSSKSKTNEGQPDNGRLANSGKDKDTETVSDSNTNPLGEVKGYKFEEGETEAEVERKWEQIISQSANDAASAGNMPGEFEELVTKILGVKALPWPTILRQFLVRNIRRGRSFRRPNRRACARADIVPSRLTKGLGKMVFGVDVSGSMDIYEMNKALAVCVDIGKVYRDFELGIVQFDTNITVQNWFTRFDSSNNYFKDWGWHGRGGTSYKAFFAQISKLKADVVVIVTDGWPNDGWPDMRLVHTPVIWLITKEADIPDNVKRYSKVLQIKD